MVAPRGCRLVIPSNALRHTSLADTLGDEQCIRRERRVPRCKRQTSQRRSACSLLGDRNWKQEGSRPHRLRRRRGFRSVPDTVLRIRQNLVGGNGISRISRFDVQDYYQGKILSHKPQASSHLQSLEGIVPHQHLAARPQLNLFISFLQVGSTILSPPRPKF